MEKLNKSNKNKSKNKKKKTENDWMERLTKKELVTLAQQLFKNIEEEKKKKEKNNFNDLNLKKLMEKERIDTKLEDIRRKKEININNRNNIFILKAAINHFNIPPLQQKIFLEKLKELMKEYKVFEVIGILIKKF